MRILHDANVFLRGRMRLAFAIIVLIGVIARLLVFRGAPYFIDLYADAYESRVVLDDPLQMYVKCIDITDREATCDGQISPGWTKEQCAPYPPIALFAVALTYQSGGGTLEGFYLAQVTFELGISAIVGIYCYREKNPLMFALFFLNPFEVSEFWYESHSSFLWMHLFAIVGFIAYDYGRKNEAGLAFSLAIASKLFPAPLLLFPRRWGKSYTYMLVPTIIGLCMPFIVPGYGYIWARPNYHFALGAACALVCVAELWFLSRAKWVTNLDIIGFASIPTAIYVTLGKFLLFPNYAMMALMLPDKRYFRPIACIFIWCAMFFEHEFTPVIVAIAVMPLFYFAFRNGLEL